MDRDAWISLGKGTGTDFAVGLEAGWGRSRLAGGGMKEESMERDNWNWRKFRDGMEN